MPAKHPEDVDLPDDAELFDQSVPEVAPLTMDTPEQHRSEAQMLRQLIVIAIIVVVIGGAVLLLSSH